MAVRRSIFHCRSKRFLTYVGLGFLIFYGTIFILSDGNVSDGKTTSFILTKEDPSGKRKVERKVPKIWPEDDALSDRILHQLSYIPENYNKSKNITIFLAQSASSWGVKPGNEIFIEQSCLVSNCILLDNFKDPRNFLNADAVLFQRDPSTKFSQKPMGQIWILYNLENPSHTPLYNDLAGKINYTASYRFDSDIVTPYEKYVIKSANLKNSGEIYYKNYAAGKTKKVAWFVSNCHDKNGRLNYAKELAKYIQVDIYGRCGNLNCHRNFANECFEMLNRDYKFYLAFENANCKDYITEKFFVNGLKHDVIPIVMGAPRQDYEKVAPKHSFIHVDDFNNSQQLANYLISLDNDDAKYNEYLRWKENAKGDFINTKFWCRLCAMLNDPKPKLYEDVDKWWRGNGVCR